MKAKNLLIIVSTIIAGLALLLIAGGVLRHFQSGPLSKAPDHGTTFLIEADFPESTAGTNDLTALKEAMLARAVRLDVRIFWEPVSATRARLSAPISDPEKAQLVRGALSRGGLLELRLVHEDSAALVQRGDIPAGYGILEQEIRLPNGQTRVERVLVKQALEPGLTGPLLKDAIVMRNNVGKPEIAFRLRDLAAQGFARFTRENIGRRVAIIVDGKLMSAPIIRAPIEGGSGVIEGDFSEPQAFELAGALDSPLPVPVKILEWKDY